MNSHKEQLDDALRTFNQAERQEFMLTTASRWLGLDGPTYIVGDVRVRALFEDIHGRHWCDAMLAAESLAGVADIGRTNPGIIEGYRQTAACMEEATDLWVFVDARGRWNATMTPVDALAHAWGYPPPTRLPDDNWARTWLSLPERSDEQELAWIANGGKPYGAYRGEGQL
ncbi:hypothetical protein AB0I54_31850 [Streptomyces sp. NPDC050625]|uniref:hypothetical protein n=1 Tax=Streptomyces sp. NPDC050625 TaxID=3154629 RepID=UPI0034340247